jgi:hypothetical protein
LGYSERKWKKKLKEWNFEKNIPGRDMGFMVERAEKRKRDEGKETEFLRCGQTVPSDKLESFKKRKTKDAMDVGVLCVGE